MRTWLPLLTGNEFWTRMMAFLQKLAASLKRGRAAELPKGIGLALHKMLMIIQCLQLFFILRIFHRTWRQILAWRWISFVTVRCFRRHFQFWCALLTGWSCCIRNRRRRKKETDSFCKSVEDSRVRTSSASRVSTADDARSSFFKQSDSSTVFFFSSSRLVLVKRNLSLNLVKSMLGLGVCWHPTGVFS